MLQYHQLIKKLIIFVTNTFNHMQELINSLVEKAGINEDQALKSIEAIKDFIKEKFPMLGGAVDNMFPSSTDSGNNN
ncbi:MAG: hypothetical protein WCG67_03335 [Ferruginibacter sp.]